MSDVPLGAFLSGGIDSSSVVAMMVEHDAVAGREDVLDRLRRAELRRVRARPRGWPQHFGTDHHEQIFTPRDADRRPAGGRRRSRRAVRGRVDPADVRALAVHARVGHRRARRRRGRRAARRVPDVPRRARGARCYAVPTAPPRACRRAAGRPAAGVDRELQPRLQAQAVPPRGGRAGGRPPRDVARRVHAGRAGARCSTRQPSTRSPSSGACSPTAPSDEPARAADLPVRDDVSAGRHPGEGRPGEHGVRRSRSARRSSTSSSSSSSAASRARLKLRRFETKHLLKRAMARTLPAGIAGRAEEGVRHPGRGMVEDASCASALRTSCRPHG